MEFSKAPYLVPYFSFYMLITYLKLYLIYPTQFYLQMIQTSMIITNSDLQEFKKDIHSILIQINTWFKSNLLSLNSDKTHFLQFLTKNSHESDLQIWYENKTVLKQCHKKIF
jgi:hypothetical protein